MARAGILYSDVARAAAKLVEDGRNPTVDGVREALGGTGSKSTIAPLLKRWKSEQQDTLAAAEPGLPASLLQAVQGLHQHMQAEFMQQLEQARQQHAEELRITAEREQQLCGAHETALAVNAAMKTDLERVQEAWAQLQATHHTQSVTLASVQAENTGLQQRLADRASEVATLDHQLSQTRAQFEHYQEAAAARRAEERQVAEQRIARLEQELAGTNRQIAAQQSMLGQQEAHIAHLTTDRADLQQALRMAQEELTAERSARERLSDRLEDAAMAKQNLDEQLAAIQRQLTDTRIALAAQEREANMLISQMRRVEERGDRLAEEKFHWLQERAALEQRLRTAEQR